MGDFYWRLPDDETDEMASDLRPIIPTRVDEGEPSNNVRTSPSHIIEERGPLTGAYQSPCHNQALRAG